MLHEIADSEQHSPRVARKRQERMVAILLAALDVARDEGRESLTVQRVAERLDMTAGALYRYFSSKDVLVAELQRTVIAWLGGVTRARVDALLADPALRSSSEAERALVGAIVTALSFEDFATHAPVEFGLLSMYLSAPEYALPDDEAARVFEAAATSLEDLAHHLARAAETGALAEGDAFERAVALWAGLQGVVQTRKLARSAPARIDPTAIAVDVVSTLLVGWGARRDVVGLLVTVVREHAFSEPTGRLEDLLQPARH